MASADRTWAMDEIVRNLRKIDAPNRIFVRQYRDMGKKWSPILPNLFPFTPHRSHQKHWLCYAINFSFCPFHFPVEVRRTAILSLYHIFRRLRIFVSSCTYVIFKQQTNQTINEHMLQKILQNTKPNNKRKVPICNCSWESFIAATSTRALMWAVQINAKNVLGGLNTLFKHVLLCFKKR